jgi:hypothetical protein
MDGGLSFQPFARVLQFLHILPKLVLAHLELQFLKLQQGDVGFDADGAAVRSAAVTAQQPASVGQFLFEGAAQPEQIEPLGDPGFGSGVDAVFAGFDPSAQQMGKTDTGRRFLPQKPRMVAVPAVAQHQDFIGIPQGEALVDAFDRIAQALFRPLQLGDVDPHGHGESTRRLVFADAETPAGGYFDFEIAACPGTTFDPVAHPGFDIAGHGIATVGDMGAQQGFKGNAGPDQRGGRREDFPIPLVAQHQSLVFVPQGETFGDAVQCFRQPRLGFA